MLILMAVHLMLFQKLNQTKGGKIRRWAMTVSVEVGGAVAFPNIWHENGGRKCLCATRSPESVKEKKREDSCRGSVPREGKFEEDKNLSSF